MGIGVLARLVGRGVGAIDEGSLGAPDGCTVGSKVGVSVALSVGGSKVGVSVALSVGSKVGVSVALSVGSVVGKGVGTGVGAGVLKRVGGGVATLVGSDVGTTGVIGADVGCPVGILKMRSDSNNL